jgi:hypothetical protein
VSGVPTNRAIDALTLQESLLTKAAVPTWSRLEPLGMTRGDLAPGLAAAVADPLWMMGRQWQFDELHGEDAASPIVVTVAGSSGRLTRYRPGSVGAAATAVDLPDLPLEVAVEAEIPDTMPERLRAEGGLHLIRLLRVAAAGPLGVGGLDAALEALAAYVFSTPDESLSTTDPNGARRRRLIAGRVPDAGALVALLSPLRALDGSLSGLPAGLDTVTPADPFRAVLADWLRWYDGCLARPLAAPDDTARPPYAWEPSRLEYAFGVQATLASGPVMLESAEYADGRLDWFDFAVTAGDLGAPTVPTEPAVVHQQLLASPVRYPGMPSDRLFEIEDGNVYLGGIEAAPHDIARLGLVEYALAYGNDWYLVPLELPYGSVCEITSVTVLDTFGFTTTIAPGFQAAAAGRPGWCMYHLGEPSDAASAPLFLLAPTVRGALEGPPLEEVALFRDEMADLVWGVERVIQGPTGEPVPWDSLAGRVSLRQTVPADLGDARIVYRLMTPIPENWIPFVSVPALGRPAGSPATQLERQPLIRFLHDGTVELTHPRGDILRTSTRGDIATDLLRLAEEEVPRDGVVVRRSYQLARTVGGGTVVWIGRSTDVGNGEGYSGLRLDTALAPGAT